MTSPVQPSPAGTPRRRNGWASLAILAGLIALPVAEIWVLIALAGQIGWWTLLVLLAGALLGGWLIRREGARAWRKLESAARSGAEPGRPLLDGALVLIGGVALIIPGLITDVIGLLLLLPFTRPVARAALGAYLNRRFGRLRDQVDTFRARGAGMVIEGEVVEGEVVDPPDDPDPGQRRTIEG